MERFLHIGDKMKIWKRDHYEKMFIKRAQTVQDYQLQILHAQDKIKELQAKCDHLEFDVTFYSWRPAAMQPARICKSCNVWISNATDEESKQLWANYYKSAGLPPPTDGADSLTTAVFTAEKKND
jgi:hypothetical protein